MKSITLHSIECCSISYVIISSTGHQSYGRHSHILVVISLLIGSQLLSTSNRTPNPHSSPKVTRYSRAKHSRLNAPRPFSLLPLPHLSPYPRRRLLERTPMCSLLQNQPLHHIILYHINAISLSLNPISPFGFMFFLVLSVLLSPQVSR